jgi:uncharacterized protein (DUF952 family)
MGMIFHIAQPEAWADGKQGMTPGFYRPEMFLTEGFVHCSTGEQVVKVADARFRGQTGLLLLGIDTEKLEAEIRYENLEGGHELFPHVYGEINTDAVMQVAEFEPGVNGYFALPVMQENASS